MTRALYGDPGFYRRIGAPGCTFRTSAHASSLWATAIHELARRIDDSMGRPASFGIVDVGAGGGELLSDLAALCPDRWALTGVDLAPRPANLPARAGWHHEIPTDAIGLVIATELLDVVPVDVAELTDSGVYVVEVALDGIDQPSHVVTGRDAEWLSRWWPLADVGDRAEIGWPRDELWHSLVGCLTQGVVVAIDYAAMPERDVAGTLTGFRNGRQVAPIPDGNCDLTAHVRFESMMTHGDVMTNQRTALRALGLTAGLPTYSGDPSTYLETLSGAAEAAELLDPGGLGAFTWLLHAVGVPQPLGDADQTRSSHPV
jgi:SAM-dependent MidA family methyltransferase